VRVHCTGADQNKGSDLGSDVPFGSMKDTAPESEFVWPTAPRL